MSAPRAQNAPPYAVVIPTLGRPSLADCLTALADQRAAGGPPPRRVLLVDDRPLDDCTPLPIRIPEPLADVVEILPGAGAGPAAARNVGWRAAGEPWVVFLDDDVVPAAGWLWDVRTDLVQAGSRTAAVQGRIRVPLPADRRPTDWERATAGLATAQWITADMAYRRTALAAVGGFDERFPRAFREDADLALRVLDAGWGLVLGARHTTHPVRPADRWVSVRGQAGNADDALMTRLHGRDWWRRAGASRGRLPRHAAVTLCAGMALAGTVTRRPRLAAACAGVWLIGTAEFTLARVLPGPRTRQEVGTMAMTSLLIPPTAVGHWARATFRHRAATPLRLPETSDGPSRDLEADERVTSCDVR